MTATSTGFCHYCKTGRPAAELEPFNPAGNLACKNVKACKARQWLADGGSICIWCGIPVTENEDGTTTGAEDGEDDFCSEAGHHAAGRPDLDEAETQPLLFGPSRLSAGAEAAAHKALAKALTREPGRLTRIRRAAADAALDINPVVLGLALIGAAFVAGLLISLVEALLS